MAVFPRISTRQNQAADLNVTFYHAGIPTDPYAITKIEIYKSQIAPFNLIATIPILGPTDLAYPAPASREYVQAAEGECGTAPPAPTEALPGRYHLIYTIPPTFTAPDVYFDVWYYYATAPLANLTDGTENGVDLQLLSCCHRFWVYPDEWFCADGLQTVNFGFEPLSQRFHKPESRPLEIGLMPLPLYDYNYNLVAPLIPLLRATITIETLNCELLVPSDPLTIGLRQGAFRNNPWVVKYTLDSSKFLIGSYKYRITLHMPDGSTRTSKSFIFSVY